jgi:hypothetical protein
MGCHLGWHFTVGCPLRGGRGECKKIRTIVLFHKKQLREKRPYLLSFLKTVFSTYCELGSVLDRAILVFQPSALTMVNGTVSPDIFNLVQF